MAVDTELPSTRERLLSAAVVSFATRGFEATSLDDLAGLVGVRKQTLLYYYPSKDELLAAVIAHGLGELVAALRPVAHGGREPRDAAFVDAVFRLGAERPELLDLLREVLRLGPPASTTLIDSLEPLIDELSAAVGSPDRAWARRLVVEAGAIVVGMATEVEVLRSLGERPTIAGLRRRRRILLDYVRSDRIAPPPAG